MTWFLSPQEKALYHQIHPLKLLTDWTTRLIGYAVMAAGAWFHQVWLVLAGLLVILSAWLWGMFISTLLLP